MRVEDGGWMMDEDAIMMDAMMSMDDDEGNVDGRGGR